MDDNGSGKGAALVAIVALIAVVVIFLVIASQVGG